MANLRLAVASLEVTDVFMHILFCGFVEGSLRFNLNGHDTSYQFRLNLPLPTTFRLQNVIERGRQSPFDNVIVRKCGWQPPSYHIGQRKALQISMGGCDMVYSQIIKLLSLVWFGWRQRLIYLINIILRATRSESASDGKCAYNQMNIHLPLTNPY